MCECFSWDEPREIFSWGLAHAICNRWNQSGCSFEWITQLVDKGRSSGCSSKACVIWAALPSKCWCLGPALSYNWLPLLVVWLLSLQGADFTCLKAEKSLWFLVKILDVSCQLYWQEDCTCWGIFLFLLKRDTINISNQIPGKSISHSQTIQAAQGILCPCTAAAKGFLKPAGLSSQQLSVGSQHSIVDMETRHLPPALPAQTGTNHQSRGESRPFKILQ